MHIIFGNEPAQLLANTHTVLELDTFHITGLGTTVTAYCVVENVPFEEMINVDSLRQKHHDMIVAYQNQNWTMALDLVGELKGHWSGELDTFYNELQARIEENSQTPPGPGWNHIIKK